MRSNVKLKIDVRRQIARLIVIIFPLGLLSYIVYSLHIGGQQYERQHAKDFPNGKYELALQPNYNGSYLRLIKKDNDGYDWDVYYYKNGVVYEEMVSGATFMQTNSKQPYVIFNHNKQQAVIYADENMLTMDLPKGL